MHSELLWRVELGNPAFHLHCPSLFTRSSIRPPVCLKPGTRDGQGWWYTGKYLTSSSLAKQKTWFVVFSVSWCTFPLWPISSCHCGHPTYKLLSIEWLALVSQYELWAYHGSMGGMFCSSSRDLWYSRPIGIWHHSVVDINFIQMPWNPQHHRADPVSFGRKPLWSIPDIHLKSIQQNTNRNWISDHRNYKILRDTNCLLMTILYFSIPSLSTRTSNSREDFFRAFSWDWLVQKSQSEGQRG